MDYRKEFVVEPGAKVRLSKIDASYRGKHKTHEAGIVPRDVEIPEAVVAG